MKILSRVLLLSAICFAMAFSTTSCEKEPQGPSQQEIETNIIGKWKLVRMDGKEIVTNQRVVCTYYTGGRCIHSNAGYIKILDDDIWIDHLELKYSLNGNVLKEEMGGLERESTIKSINADRMTMSLDRVCFEGQIKEAGQLLEFVKVTTDFSQDVIGFWEGVEMTGDETHGDANHCIEYKTDGSYTYYDKVGDSWVPRPDASSNYNVDGDWLATRWQATEVDDYNYERWDIESIKDGQMKWTALRAREDGSTFATTFTWKKVSPADVIPYLFIKAVEDGATVSLDTFGNFEVLPSIEYSTDGQNWTAFDFGNPQTVTLAKAGDKVFWRNTGKSSYFSSTKDHIKIDLVSFVIGDKKVAVGGNIMSLIDKSCQSLTIPCDYCFPDLFHDCTSLVSASELKLPATELTSGCYCRMFSGCTSLESVPELPAKELARFCYGGMFSGCTSLESAPELPATEIARSCYSIMFDGCTSLKTAPALPATELATECYFGMYSGCTSLKTAPALPATELADNCYQVMFEGCISLEEAPGLPATELAANCYQLMFEGCISLEEAPALPATELANGCYLGMFYGCTNLRHINVGFEKWGAEESMATYGWLLGVSPEGTFECPEGLEINYGVNSIPEGWTVETR